MFRRGFYAGKGSKIIKSGRFSVFGKIRSKKPKMGFFAFFDRLFANGLALGMQLSPAAVTFAIIGKTITNKQLKRLNGFAGEPHYPNIHVPKPDYYVLLYVMSDIFPFYSVEDAARSQTKGKIFASRAEAC